MNPSIAKQEVSDSHNKQQEKTSKGKRLNQSHTTEHAIELNSSPAKRLRCTNSGETSKSIVPQTPEPDVADFYSKHEVERNLLKNANKTEEIAYYLSMLQKFGIAKILEGRVFFRFNENLVSRNLPLIQVNGKFKLLIKTCKAKGLEINNQQVLPTAFRLLMDKFEEMLNKMSTSWMSQNYRTIMKTQRDFWNSPRNQVITCTGSLTPVDVIGSRPMCFYFVLMELKVLEHVLNQTIKLNFEDETAQLEDPFSMNLKKAFIAKCKEQILRASTWSLSTRSCKNVLSKHFSTLSIFVQNWWNR